MRARRMTPDARGPRTIRVAYWDRRKARNAVTALWLHARSWQRRLRGRPAVPDATQRLSGTYPQLFVVGCPRSGTTWITSILAAHPRVINAAESHAYATILGPFAERRLRGDRGWRRVLTRYDLLAHRGWNVGVHRYVDRRTLCDFIVNARSHPDWSDEQAAEHVIGWIFDHFFAARGGTPGEVLVEKTPDHLFHARRILRTFPRARIVEVVRDGRDVCASMQRLAAHEWWPPRERRAQIETWRQHIECGAALRADPAYAQRVVQVRYESVRSDPARAVSELFTFAGLDASPAQIAEIVAATDIARSGPAAGSKAPQLGLVGGWREQFTSEDIALFTRLAGAALRDAGYST
jgi:hypothetical protein